MAAVTRSASASPSGILHFSSTLPTSVIDPSCFPLKSTADVVQFFRRSLEQTSDPDLTLLSIVAGYIELSLTTGNVAQEAAAAASASDNACVGPSSICPLLSLSSPLIGALGISSGVPTGNTDIISCNSIPFPVVTYELVTGLYKKFQRVLSTVEKPKYTNNRQASREVISKVSDIIWRSLIRTSCKDRAHLQNLYSYLSGNKLDCFGVALAVVAGCQLLGYRDVHLAISEDHAWVVFGNKRLEMIEVTWHGKGIDDKRGQDVIANIESGSWLYLNGMAVFCDKFMEVAAIVSAINVTLTTNNDCVEMAELQQKLLWLLYDMGHLRKYPIGLGMLGELEEVCRTHPTITCEQLYREAIQSARKYYHNHHVYPYTYLGNYYNRLLKYREAFSSWANAADVIRLYTYNCRDDEDIYKELLDIANDTIPYVMKTESSGHSARSILRDSEVFANLLRFYDGICQWEEDSLTPILHIGWAKPLVNSITKFDYDIRSQIVIKVPEDEAPITQTAGEKDVETKTNIVAAEVQKHDIKIEINNSEKNIQIEGNNNIVAKKDEKLSNDPKRTDMSTTLADLTVACGEKILNPEFLLQGGGQPFADSQKQTQQQKKEQRCHHKINDIGNIVEERGELIEDHAAGTVKVDGVEGMDSEISEIISPSTLATSSITVQDDTPFEFTLKRPVITLYSQKMKGLKELLLSEKLNTHAISLQLTAQSVASRKVRGIDKQGNHTTTSTYATVNVMASHCHNQYHNYSGSVIDTAASDSIALSRPKRTRRE